jgi:hypothetical protein
MSDIPQAAIDAAGAEAQSWAQDFSDDIAAGKCADRVYVSECLTGIADAILQAAAPAITGAERERIRQLAIAAADRGAKTGLDRIGLRAFADVLREGS